MSTHYVSIEFEKLRMNLSTLVVSYMATDPPTHCEVHFQIALPLHSGFQGSDLKTQISFKSFFEYQRNHYT